MWSWKWYRSHWCDDSAQWTSVLAYEHSESCSLCQPLRLRRYHTAAVDDELVSSLYNCSLYISLITYTHVCSHHMMSHHFIVPVCLSLKHVWCHHHSPVHRYRHRHSSPHHNPFLTCQQRSTETMTEIWCKWSQSSSSWWLGIGVLGVCGTSKWKKYISLHNWSVWTCLLKGRQWREITIQVQKEGRCALE